MCVPCLGMILLCFILEVDQNQQGTHGKFPAPQWMNPIQLDHGNGWEAQHVPSRSPASKQLSHRCNHSEVAALKLLEPGKVRGEFLWKNSGAEITIGIFQRHG